MKRIFELFQIAQTITIQIGSQALSRLGTTSINFDEQNRRPYLRLNTPNSKTIDYIIVYYNYHPDDYEVHFYSLSQSAPVKSFDGIYDENLSELILEESSPLIGEGDGELS